MLHAANNFTYFVFKGTEKVCAYPYEGVILTHIMVKRYT